MEGLSLVGPKGVRPLHFAQCAALQGLDRAGPLAERAGDLLDRHVADDAQQQDRALVGGQLGDRRPPPGPVEARARVLVDVAARARLALDELVRGGLHRAPRAAAQVVDEPAVGDGEHPGAEGALVAAEARQPAHDLQEDLAGQVLGLGRAVRAQVAGDARRQGRVDALPRPIGPRAGGRQCRLEPLHVRRKPYPKRTVGIIPPAMTTVTELKLPTIDYMDPALVGPAFRDTLRDLRERSWLARAEPLGWFVLDHEATAFFLRSKAATFPGRLVLEVQGVTSGPLYERLQGNLLARDGEDHRRLRKLIQPAFTPKAADAYRPAMR